MAENFSYASGIRVWIADHVRNLTNLEVDEFVNFLNFPISMVILWLLMNCYGSWVLVVLLLGNLCILSWSIFFQTMPGFPWKCVWKLHASPRAVLFAWNGEREDAHYNKYWRNGKNPNKWVLFLKESSWKTQISCYVALSLSRFGSLLMGSVWDGRLSSFFSERKLIRLLLYPSSTTSMNLPDWKKEFTTKKF